MKQLRSTGLVVGILLISSIFFCARSQDNGGANGKSNNDKEQEAVGDAAKGQATFQTSCLLCHDVDNSDDPGNKVGPGLKGISKKGPHKLRDGTEHKDHSPDVLRKQLVVGGGTMPPIGASMQKADIDNLIAYLETL